MALGVVGAVGEETCHGGGVGTAADGSGLFEVGGGEVADAQEGGVEAMVEFLEESGFRGVQLKN